VNIQTNAPTGSVPFTFNETQISNNTAATAITGLVGTARYALGASTPAGVVLVDNLDGTFDVTLKVDPNGDMLPIDATTFDIEISDSNTPGTVVYTEKVNLTVKDLKQEVLVKSKVEDKVAEIVVDFDNVLEAGKVRIPTDKQSSEMAAFIKENQGGSYSISGTSADLFRVNEQTGEVVSKKFLHFNSADADANKYNIDVTYTVGTNSFTDKASITLVNSTADDNVNQAAGRPLVGTDAIQAASLVSENENITIFGNVGTSQIDVNGGSSAYELVQAINSRQGETGVYADANTRVNINFPDQFEPLDDAISFMLQGNNGEPILISGNVEFGIVGGRDANVRGLADAINGASGKTGISAKVSPNGSTLHMVSNEGHDILVENFTMSVQNIPMNISATDDEFNSIGDVQQLTKGVGNDDTFRSTGQITFHSPYVFSIETSLTGINGGGLFQLTPGAAKLSSVSQLDVLTVDNSKKMLTAVDAALVRIDLERSDLGATMSRMEHTIRNLSNIVVNTKAARSRIQDANIAEETTNMTKAQVLSQAAQAMLAQANRTSQSILSLLQG
jgi:flagellin